MTTIDRAEAEAAGVQISQRRDQYVRTGNGIIRVSTGRADELQVGGISRRDVGLQIAENDSLNVLGMNFLSSLSRWSVEGRWLVLVS
jgi:aspartyl protease family protein